MLIPPKYFLNNKISRLLSQIEANREVVNSISIPPEIELNLRRKSTLRSSLFSARIEGNTATPDDFSHLSTKDKKKKEISNILSAINWILERKAGKEIVVRNILDLHTFVMKNVDDNNIGKFRTTHEGIFTTSGVLVYHAPPPSQIIGLISRLLKFANSQKEEFPVIRAALVHYSFEKIHPFIDGSGRVGRLLILMILKNASYDFKGILPFEEEIDKRRETYYKMLEESEKDITAYIEFMLEIIYEASQKAREMILTSKSVSTIDFFIPRRQEIYQIVKDHKLVNLDFIKRRFLNVNSRTLRNDFKKLQEAKLIQKLGTTRGVYYKII